MAILAIPFNNYSTDPKGHIVGELRTDMTTGYEYRFVQAAQSLIGAAFAAGDVVISKTTATYEGTNDGDGGYDATYPPGLGIANSACPQSTATVTYYFWVLRTGYFATIKTNGDDDIAAGNMLITSTTDGACDSLAGTATNTADGVIVQIFGRASAADVDSANTVAGFVDFRF